jgi:hypothetical protein
MNRIPEPLLQSLRLGTALAAEVTASNLERVAGVTIFPKQHAREREAEREGWKPSIPDRGFTVYWREYSQEYLNTGWDDGDEGGIWELKQAEAVTEQELEQLLEEWGISPSTLTYLWKTNIPE